MFLILSRNVINFLFHFKDNTKSERRRVQQWRWCMMPFGAVTSTLSHETILSLFLHVQEWIRNLRLSLLSCRRDDETKVHRDDEPT